MVTFYGVLDAERAYPETMEAPIQHLAGTATGKASAWSARRRGRGAHGRLVTARTSGPTTPSLGAIVYPADQWLITVASST